MELHPLRTLGIGATPTTNGFVASALPVPDLSVSPPTFPATAPNANNGLVGQDIDVAQQILQLVIVKTAANTNTSITITPTVSYPNAPTTFVSLQNATGGTQTYVIDTTAQIANCSSGAAFSAAAAGNAITLNIPINTTSNIQANLNDGSSLAASAQRRIYALRAAVTAASGGSGTAADFTILGRILHN
jgi:hypothetical protein